MIATSEEQVGDLFGAGLGFLQADHVGIGLLNELRETFAQYRPDPVHVPGDQFQEAKRAEIQSETRVTMVAV